jgi:hypothetical protein
MSAEDPTIELNEILMLVNSGKLPKKAAVWAKDCLDTAQDILDLYNLTDAQEEALENIYRGACKWLHRKP